MTAESTKTEAVTVVRKIGTLSMLNMSEEEMANLYLARELINEHLVQEGYRKRTFGIKDLASSAVVASVKYVYEVV